MDNRSSPPAVTRRRPVHCILFRRRRLIHQRGGKKDDLGDGILDGRRELAKLKELLNSIDTRAKEKIKLLDKLNVYRKKCPATAAGSVKSAITGTTPNTRSRFTIVTRRQLAFGADSDYAAQDADLGDRSSP